MFRMYFYVNLKKILTENKMNKTKLISRLYLCWTKNEFYILWDLSFLRAGVSNSNPNEGCILKEKGLAGCNVLRVAEITLL